MYGMLRNDLHIDWGAIGLPSCLIIRLHKKWRMQGQICACLSGLPCEVSFQSDGCCIYFAMTQARTGMFLSRNTISTWLRAKICPLTFTKHFISKRRYHRHTHYFKDKERDPKKKQSWFISVLLWCRSGTTFHYLGDSGWMNRLRSRQHAVVCIGQQMCPTVGQSFSPR